MSIALKAIKPYTSISNTNESDNSDEGLNNSWLLKKARQFFNSSKDLEFISAMGDLACLAHQTAHHDLASEIIPMLNTKVFLIFLLQKKCMEFNYDYFLFVFFLDSYRY